MEVKVEPASMSEAAEKYDDLAEEAIALGEAFNNTMNELLDAAADLGYLEGKEAGYAQGFNDAVTGMGERAEVPWHDESRILDTLDGVAGPTGRAGPTGPAESEESLTLEDRVELLEYQLGIKFVGDRSTD